MARYQRGVTRLTDAISAVPSRFSVANLIVPISVCLCVRAGGRLVGRALGRAGGGRACVHMILHVDVIEIAQTLMQPFIHTMAALSPLCPLPSLSMPFRSLCARHS